MLKALSFAEIFPMEIVEGSKVTPPVSTPFLNAGVLVILHGNLTSTNQQNIQNSLLISQLAADRKFNRHNEVGEWYRMFSSTLGNIGWVINSNDFQLNQPTNPTFNLASLALNEMARMNLIKEDVEKFRRVANMLQQLPEDSDLLKLLYKNRTELSAGASIMMAVGRLANESSVVIQLYIITAMSSSEGTKKYLAHIYSSQSVQLD